MLNLDRIFNPHVVVVIGDKQKNNYMWLQSMKAFKGKVYSVQTNEKEIAGIEAMGIQNYRSILDVPDEVDYVVISVPRKAVPQVLKDCIQKKVGGVGMFTAGYAETLTDEGISLQKEITDLARANNLLIVGPNCMGIYNPEIGLRHNECQLSYNSGKVGFIAQSGTFAVFFSLAGMVNGIKINKSVSYGNGIILDSTDYLEYFAADKGIDIIGIYIESIKDGRRFLKALGEVTVKKPVVIWKGGQTSEGARATASHTGSMAESLVVWDALIKQTGAIRVDTLEEMIDVVKGFLYIKPVTGNNVAIITMTGGPSVSMTDAFVKKGFKVPLLTEDSYRELGSFFDIIGGSYRNPLDIISSWHFSEDTLLRILKILEKDSNIDSIVMDLSHLFILQRMIRGEKENHKIESMLGVLKAFKDDCKKPFFVTFNPLHQEVYAAGFKESLTRKGVASFHSYESAANALSQVVRYNLFRYNYNKV
ncbi:MAG: CoA-binding protein [Chloroflexi bacterium]|nr:CoA-binding protein [Chloroflexota bacterium]